MSVRNGSRLANAIIHTIVILMSLTCLFPFVHMLAISFSDQMPIITMKVTLWPVGFQTLSYWTILQDPNFFRSFFNTVFITVAGTAINLIMTIITAYPLIKRKVKGRTVIMKLIVFTMLFNGGLVSRYLVYTQVLGLKDSYVSLIIPLLIIPFNVIIMRTFFQTTIHPALIESARIDGAGEIRIFATIVLPLSLPVLATMALFSTINYWNDWFNGLVYLSDPQLFSIQNILNRILTDIQFLSSGMADSRASGAAQQLPSTSVRMAIAVVGAIPILIAYPFFQKYFIKGITIGAVKG